MLDTHQIFDNANYMSSQQDSVIIPALNSQFEISNQKPSFVTSNCWENLLNKINQPLTDKNSIIQNAYMHLVLIEDLFAIYEDSEINRVVMCETWLADKWHNHCSEEWKKIIAEAWLTQVNDINGCDYFRPSLCLRSSTWLKIHGFNYIPAISYKSLTFYKNPCIFQASNSNQESEWCVEY